MQNRIETGDRVKVTLGQGGYFEDFEAVVDYKPCAEGDSWVLIQDDGRVIYVQRFETMILLSNASVSIPGGEPEYVPRTCSAGALECVIDAIVHHDEEHPDHGVGCICMDRHAGAIRRLISARMLNVPGREKSLRNLRRALGYIVNNP